MVGPSDAISEESSSDEAKDGVVDGDSVSLIIQRAQAKGNRMEYSKLPELGLELGVGTALLSET
jgi:hypothetical protein